MGSVAAVLRQFRLGRAPMELLALVLLAGVLTVLPGGRLPLTGTVPAGATGVGLATLAGSGSVGQADGSAGSATFDSLQAVAADASGDYLYVLDVGTQGRPNKIRKVSTSSGAVTTFATGGLLAENSSTGAGKPTHILVDGQGRVWVALSLSSSEKAIVRYPAAGGTPTVMVSGICCGYYNSTSFVGGAFAIDPTGQNLYYNFSKDFNGDRFGQLYRISVSSLPAGATSGVAVGGPGAIVREAMADMEFGSDGNLYLIWPGTGSGGSGYEARLWRYNGPESFTDVGGGGYDGRKVAAFSPATSSAYFLCSGCAGGSETLVRQGSFGAGSPDYITGSSTGFADGIPGKLDSPSGLAISPDASTGWIADRDNHRIRVVDLPYDPALDDILDASEFFGPNASMRHQYPAQACACDPVDTRTGNLHMPGPALAVAGRGAGLAFQLGYNSLAASDEGRAGYGWANTLDMSLAVRPDGSALVTQETGATIRFAPDGSGGWTTPDRFSAVLENNGDGTITFTRRHFASFLFAESDGRLLSMSDQFDNTTSLHYPTGSTEADYMQDSAGRRLLIGWAGGRIVSVTDQLSGSGGPRSLTFTYSGAGDLVDVEDPAGGHWVYTYDTAHRMLTMRKPRQSSSAKVIENHYDGDGRVDWQEDELNRRTSLAYDTPASGSTKITNPDGSVQIDRFVDGRREETLIGVGTPDELSTSFTYDPATLALKRITDNAGKVTTLTLDAAGNQTSVTDPTGRVTRWTYNGFDQVTSVATGETSAPLPASTSAVVTVTSTLDSLGRLTKTTEAVGTPKQAETNLVYGDSSHPEDVTTVVDQRSKSWLSTFDAGTGDRLSATDPEGNKTGWEYNNVGWMTKATSPKGTATPVSGDFETTWVYDIGARTTTVTGPEGDVTRTVLDANGNTASVATDITSGSPAGDLTTYSYTDADEPQTVDPPGTGAKTFEYWPDGQRKRFTNENGAHWDYVYDGARRLETETDPAGSVTSYGYDTAGRMATITQPGAGSTCTGTKSGCVTYSYDDAGRPIGIDYSDPGTPDVTGITYDALGRRTGAATNGTTETWSWDPRSRLTATSDANGRATSYGYDDGSNLTSITYPGQSTAVVRGFDEASRLTSVTDWAGKTTSFDYDANSNWTDTTFPTGTNNTDVFGYDTADRMTSASWKKGSTTIGSETYTRPSKGLVGSVTRSGAAGAAPTAYDYDDRARLTDDNTDTFTYDPASNLTERGDGTLQVFDPAQRLCWTSPTASTGSCSTPSADATTFAYDARGNRTTEIGPAADGSKTLAYDQANRLTDATITDGLEGGEGQYHEIAAKRIVDTRYGTGTCIPTGCPKAQAGTPLQITVGGGSIPSSDVVAVAATVSILSPNITSYARVNPTGSSGAATVNFKTGQDANRFVVAPVINGKIVVQLYGTNAQAHVVVDVTGYYTTANGSAGSTYTAKAPSSRLVDTRTGVEKGLCPTTTCDTLPAQTNVSVQAAGREGIPASGTRAAVLSVTVVNPANSGYLKVAPGTTGAAATINYQGSETINLVVVTPIDANGRFTLKATTAVDVIVDVAGWYTDPPAGSPGTALATVTPARIVDTRYSSGTCFPSCGKLAAQSQVRYEVRGHGGIAADATAVVGFITLVDPAGTGFLRVNPVGSGTGTTGSATMNYNNGDSGGIMIMVPIASDGTITMAASSATHMVLDVTGYFSGPTTGTWNYSYGSDGIRSKKQGPSGPATEFTWSAGGGMPLLLGEHTGSTDTWIIYGPGGQPIEQIRGTTTSWLHRDQLGSIRLATDSSGNTVGTRSWDAYGNPVVNTGTVDPLLGYAGQYTDQETGYQYLRARYYDPTTSQFLTVDPFVSQTQEPYGYTRGNPVNATDPLGLWPWDGKCVDLGALPGVDDDPECETLRESEGGTAQGIQRGAEMYADDLSNYSAGVAGVCAVGAVVSAASVAAAPLAVPLGACAGVATGVSVVASTVHTAATCAGGVDDYCTRSFGATLFTASMAGIGLAAGRGGMWLFAEGGCDPALLKPLSNLFPGLATGFESIISVIALDTTERPS